MKTLSVMALGALFLIPTFPVWADDLNIAQQARRVLAANCFECHGPDEEGRKAKLRFDTRDGALADHDGVRAIVPGAPEKSEAIIRIRSTDPDEVMPPPKHHKPLKASEIALLEQWIREGAAFDRHWAFVPPERPAVPKTRHATRNPIDHFVFAQLEREGIPPAAVADKYTLVRRVYLDLIGLPPSPEEADAFVNDAAPQAYEQLVDRLLESPRYGERWARRWLDLARYADTNGYEKDRPRTIWPYRDWVIKALNDDMPYDQFSIEQLAGDMLPKATHAQRIATGLHRNTMLNEEGGIDPLEYRFYAMVDRVATTGTIWMGLTVGCAQCHTHKYDPITHTDYYNFMALLNNADEPDLAMVDQDFRKREAAWEQEHQRIIDDARKVLDRPAYESWVKAAAAKARDWEIVKPSEMVSTLPYLSLEADGSIFAAGDFTKRDVYTLRFSLDQPKEVAALRLEVLPDDRLPEGGPGRAYYEGRKGDFFLSELAFRHGGKDLKFVSGSASYGKISIGSGKAKAENLFDGVGSTGWATSGQEGKANQLVLNLAEPLELRGEIEIELLFERHFVAGLGKFRISLAAEAGEAKAWDAHTEALLVKGEPHADLEAAYIAHASTMAKVQKKLQAHMKKRPKSTHTMVMQERPEPLPRPTFRHHRGEYLSPREAVSPAVPALFPAIEGPENRLSFARWLVSDQNPLAARVAVNRAWEAFFGRGLVPTLDDFGVQAAPPVQPELLDWLACELVAQRWSMKQLHRLIVHSAVYRQASNHRSELTARDPFNDLLARGPRFRVEGEMVRDLMLKSCGVLTDKLGGPSVRPPQPAAVAAIAYGGTKWPASTGPDRYRRSLYTFSKRTAPFAAYTVFDAPTGESCIARRDRSNTPLQALTLLNDDMFMELARALGKTALEQSNPGVFVFRRLLVRPPDAEELAKIKAYYASQLARLASGPLDPKKVCKDPAASAEWAAWTLVARVMMNLDETITKS